MELDLKHVKDASLPYLFSKPSVSKPETGWPMLCFLHGYGEAADRMEIREALTKHGPFKNDRIVNEFLIVAPQMPIAG